MRFIILMVCFAGLQLSVAQKRGVDGYIITHSGDTLHGLVKYKSSYLDGYYRVMYKNDRGKWEKVRVFESEISEVKMGTTLLVARWIDDAKDSGLFDIDKRTTLGDFAAWEVTYITYNSMMGANGMMISTPSSSTVFYLEEPGSERMTTFPRKKRPMLKFLRKNGCDELADRVDSNAINGKETIEVMKAYIDECLLLNH